MNNNIIWRSQFTDCIYSNYLIEKLEQLNSKNIYQINIDLIKKAIFYARKYHGTQLRKSGEPYYSHPIEVAYLVADHLINTEILIVAILHDTIEDTELNVEMISYLFNSSIANNVMDLTRLKNGKKTTAADTVITLYNEGKHGLLLVKLFDRLHNIRTLGVKSPKSIKKIAKETLSIFISVARFFKLWGVVEELTSTCMMYLELSGEFKDLAQYTAICDNTRENGCMLNFDLIAP